MCVRTCVASIAVLARKDSTSLRVLDNMLHPLTNAAKMAVILIRVSCMGNLK